MDWTGVDLWMEHTLDSWSPAAARAGMGTLEDYALLAAERRERAQALAERRPAAGGCHIDEGSLPAGE